MGWQESSPISLVNVGVFVASIAALQAYPVTDVITGTQIYVSTTKSQWTAVIEADPGTSNGITIVRDATNTITYYRSTETQLVFSFQTAWYIDSINGNDENNGSIAFPIKTWAELERRLGTSRLNGHYYIFAPNGFIATDYVRMRFNMGLNGQIHIIGSQTPIAGTNQILTGVTALDRATGQHQEITVNAFDWTPYVNKMVRITASAAPGNVGAIAWVQANLGAGKARVCAFQLTVYGAVGTTVFSSLTLVTPLVGDTIEVVNLASIPEKISIATGVGSSYSGRYTVEDFSIGAGSTTISNSPLNGEVRFNRCWIQNENTGGSSYQINQACYVSGTIQNDITGSSIFECRGGLISGQIFVSSQCILQNDCLLSDASISSTAFPDGRIFIANVGVASANATLFSLGQLTRTFFSPGSTLYGTTNNNIGFILSAGASIVTPTGVVPTLNTGVASNISMHAGINKVWADLATTYMNPANNSQLLADVA